MNSATIYITGGLGCIGAQTTRWLLTNTDARVVITCQRVDEDRTASLLRGVPLDRLQVVELDIRDAPAVSRQIQRYQPTHVIHLAALQSPDCNADRDRGLQINLAGTQHLLEAIRSTGLSLQRFLYASSIAVYGPRSDYGAGRVPMLAPPRPVNVYGVWKLAAEHLCRIFFEETGTPSVVLRPGVLFGPGRDRGLTSTPTTAIKHVARGEPYTIPFHNRQDYLYSPDVGAAFAIAALEAFDGFGCFTLPAHTRDTYAFVDAIEAAANVLGIAESCQVTVGKEEVPFVCDLEYQPFCAAFPDVPHTEFSQAVLETLQYYVEHGK